MLRTGGADDAAQERCEEREREAAGEARDLDVLSVARIFAMWVRAFEERGLMSSARPSRVTTTANWLRGFWSKNSSMKGGRMNLKNRQRRRRRGRLHVDLKKEIRVGRKSVFSRWADTSRAKMT